MNGILDISDKGEGSQLSTIKDSIDELNELLPKYRVASKTPSEVDAFEIIIKGQVIRHNDNVKYFKKCLENIKLVKTNDKLEVIKDLYLFVCKLHRFHKYFFNAKYKQLSEADFMIKIWSHLLPPSPIEIMFRSSDDVLAIISHWGDTTVEEAKDDGKIIKMDLRLIACETPIELNETIDTAVAEFDPTNISNQNIIKTK